MTDLDKTRIRFGPFEVDLATRELRKSGLRLKLGGQPFEILATLLEKPGQLVTREQLRQRLWASDTFVDFGHGLSAAVNKLREVLNDSAEEPRYVETLPRRGYRFIGSVTTPGVQDSRVAAPSNAVAPSIPAPFSPDVGIRPKGSQTEWKGAFIAEEWQATVPVPRQTLVKLGVLLPVAVVVGLALTQLWSWWPEPSAPEQRERALKVAAERAATSGVQGPSIWRAELTGAHEVGMLRRVISDRDSIGGPQPSPDGKRLAYSAGDLNATQIWVCHADGSFPKMLTRMASAGTPRWSPDSQWIAFDSDGRFGHAGIYLVSPDSGAVRPVVDDGANNSVPSWSRDGKWIYFASNHAYGEPQEQVWKISVDDGRLVQVTRQGGFSAYESLDGKTVYYAKSRYEDPEIWQVPANGGSEARVSGLLRPRTWAAWALTDDGIYFLGADNEPASDLQYYNFAERSVRSIGALDRTSFWLSASQDGSSIWYSELTDDQARLVFKAGLD